MENFIEKWWGLIYFIVMLIGYMGVYIWWYLSSENKRENTVYWPLEIIIMVWPLTLLCFIIAIFFYGLSHFMIYVIKKGITMWRYMNADELLKQENK